MNKTALRIICLIILCCLLFPSMVFAGESNGGSGIASSEPSAEITEEPSAAPSSETSQIDSQDQSDGSDERQPEPGGSEVNGLNETVIAEIINQSATDGAGAAQVLNGYQGDAHFSDILLAVLDLYVHSGEAAQCGLFINSLELEKAELSADIAAIIPDALPAAGFGGALSNDAKGNIIFACPKNLSAQAETAFTNYLSAGEDTVQTAFAFAIPEGAVSADVYGLETEAPGKPVKLTGQTGVYENVARMDGDGFAILPADGAVRTAIAVFRDADQNIVSIKKAGYTVSLQAAETQACLQPSAAGEMPYVEGEVLVVFNDNVSETQENSLISQLGTESAEQNDISVVAVDEGVSVEAVVDGLNADPNVLLAQPNYIYHLLEAETGLYPQTTAVNDPLFSNQWYLDYIGMREAWDYSKTSNKVKVAVLDTGIDPTHPDLTHNIAYAWDAVNNKALTGDLDVHGTHVAGIIAAEANNGVGIAGVSYNASLIPINVFYTYEDDIQTDSLQLCKGYDIAMNQGARVVNMSLGGSWATDSGGNLYADDQLLLDKIDLAASQGIVTVCAGGNKPSSAAVFPGDYETCISVVPVDSTGTIASFASYNDAKDIAAPGVNVYSTYPQSMGSYSSLNGSSMAAPVISGIVADMIAANPSLSVEQIKQLLYSNATDDAAYPGKDAHYGNGIVNAEAALHDVDGTPPTSTGITHSASPSLTPTFTVTAEGVADDKSGVARVRFAVWSESNGQDDIKWYEGINGESGSWTATVNAADHNNEAGSYLIDVYGTDSAGNTGFLGGTSIIMDHRDTAAPSITGGITQSVSPCTTSSFYVTAYNVTDDKSGVASVRFAVWSENGGQDDIRWYNGMNYGSGNWSVFIFASDHKNDIGRYQIHIYGTDSVGNTGFMGSTAIVMDHRDSAAPTITGGITQSASPCATSSFYVRANNVTDDKSGVKNVRFAVWSENGGQDDLRWYNGIYNGAAGWSVVVYAIDHKDDVGRYQIHIYGTDNSGNTGFLASTAVVMDHRDTAAPVMNGRITQSASPCTTSSFYVRANNVADDKSGVKSVRFAVWSENGGQDDLRWYNGIYGGGGIWTAVVFAADHKDDTGRYQIHIYGTDSAGNTGFMGSTAIVMDHRDHTPPAVASFYGISYGIYGENQIIIMDMQDKTGVKNVRAAVWSDVYGQDDLVWYDAYGSGGQWGITVPVSNHGDKGTYSVHVYATDTLGNTGFAGATAFSVFRQ